MRTKSKEEKRAKDKERSKVNVGSIIVRARAQCRLK